MYRTRNMEKENAASEQFVDKLRDLPMVSDTLGKLGALYTGTKEHNRLFRFTLSTAESGLGFMYSTAKPVVKKFEKPIGTLNGIACQQLDKLEKDYPIIAQPTEMVIKQTKESCTAAVKPVADRVKPITDTVGSVTKFGVDKISSAKTYTVETIEGVTTYSLNKVNDMKTFSVNKVNDVKTFSVSKVNDVKTYSVNKVIAASDAGSKQMSRMLETQTSQMLIAQVEILMGVADSYVDKYLPAGSDESDGEKSSSKNKKGDETKQTAVMNKAWSLGTKVRRRAYNRAAKELRDVRMRSAETMSRMSPVDLLEYARTNVGNMREKVHFVWEEINKPADEVANEETESEQNRSNLTYERRFIATARHVTLKIKSGAAALNLSIETVPGPIRPIVLQALEFAQHLFATLLTRPTAGLSSKSCDEEMKKSLPSLTASSYSSTQKYAAQSKVSPTATNKNDSDAEKKVTEPTNKSAASAPAYTPEQREEQQERRVSSSSSDQQDDQTYAEPQDDSPDSYE